MDRFRPVPDVPRRAGSWAEWLYFKGRAGDVQFYMTFLAGPRLADGRRAAGVRFQLDRGGETTSYSSSASLDEATLVHDAPDLTIGGASVRLEGMRYHVTLDLPHTDATRPGRVSGDFVIEASPGRSLTPIELRGAGGWVSGYTVPVMSGALSGAVVADGVRLDLAGAGYHDHNWGFWEGVSWRWGQVQHEGLSYRLRPCHPAAGCRGPRAFARLSRCTRARWPGGLHDRRVDRGDRRRPGHVAPAVLSSPVADVAWICGWTSPWKTRS